MVSRLPNPGGDNGNWGDILNDYLLQSHKADGTHKTDSVGSGQIQDNTIQKAKLSASVQSSLNLADTASQITPHYPGGAVATTAARPGWLDVRDYGAIGNNTADDTAAIQAAINAAGAAGGGIVFLPVGIYKISSALDFGGNVRHNVTIQGAGPGYPSATASASASSAATAIRQTSTTAHAIISNDTINIGIKDMSIVGPGSGSGDGVHLTWTANTNIVGVTLENVTVTNWGGNGLSTQTMLLSSIRNVLSTFNGGKGFYLYGGGTSTTFDNCWAAGNAGIGWDIAGQNYSTFNACAADGNTIGWFIHGGSSTITLNGCGAEDNTVDGLQIDGCQNVTINGFAVVYNNHYGIYVGTTAYSVILNNIAETGPRGGATNSIYIEEGAICSVHFTNVITANHFSSTTNSETFGTYEALILKATYGVNATKVMDAANRTIMSFASFGAAANYFSILSAPVGTSPQMYATGVDTDVSFTFIPKGNGSLSIFSLNSGVTPTIQADGVDGNIDINLKTKGTGVVRANGNQIPAIVTVPTSATSAGTVGQIAYSSTYFYVCVGTNTWVRSPLTTW